MFKLIGIALAAAVGLIVLAACADSNSAEPLEDSTPSSDRAKKDPDLETPSDATVKTEMLSGSGCHSTRYPSSPS